MPSTALYSADYYQSHKSAILTRKETRRERYRDPVTLARVTWLRAIMATHTLTTQDLGVLLSISTHGITLWLLHSDRKNWAPITAGREAQIRAVLSEEAPMTEDQLNRLGWSSLRRAAYLTYWGRELPEVRGTQVRTWRLGRHSQKAVAQMLDISIKCLQDWESGQRSIPLIPQKSLRWLMEHGEKGEEMTHTPECLEATHVFLLAEKPFWARFPHACTTCHGRGVHVSAYDPSPPGVSLGAGVLWDIETCQDCEGSEDVPMCALCGQICTEDGTRLCQCPREAYAPYRPECLCWDREENTA